MADMRLVNEADELLAAMDDDQLACWGQQHKWPVLHPKRKRPPKNWHGTRNRDGSFHIVEVCENGCGRFRETTTLPGGIEADTARYYYGWLPDVKEHRVRIPRAVGLSKKRMRNELRARCIPQILEAAPAAEAEAAEASRRVPETLPGSVSEPARPAGQGDGLAPVFRFGRPA